MRGRVEERQKPRTDRHRDRRARHPDAHRLAGVRQGVPVRGAGEFGVASGVGHLGDDPVGRAGGRVPTGRLAGAGCT
eukprot:ctg_282.g111